MGRIVRNEIDYSGSPLVTDSTPNASSVNPVTSAGVYKAIVGQEELLKDTVGFTSKNLIPFPYQEGQTVTKNGITYTVDSNGVVTANGTATNQSRFYLFLNSQGKVVDGGKEYIISGAENVGNDIEFAIALFKGDTYVNKLYLQKNVTNEVRFQVDSTVDYDGTDVYILIPNGVTVSNLVFRPMIRKADIIDSTYEQYNPSVKQILRNNKIIEGKNLLKYPYEHTSGTWQGITWTDNGDGSVKINGETTNMSSTFIINKHDYDLPKGTYILNVGGTYDLEFFCSGYNGNTYVRNVGRVENHGGDILFTIDYSDYDNVQFGLYINKNKTIDNVTVYPMLRKATETDPTYEKYYIPGVVSQEAQNVLGAKNLLGFKENKVIEDKGVTYSYDEATGCLTINGTNTDSSAGAWGTTSLKYIPKGRYILSGLIKGDSVVTQIEFNSTDGTFGNHNIFSNGTNDFGGSFEITDDTKTYRINVRVEKSATANNIKIYPMLRLADVKDDTWTPYAKTNRDITEMLTPVEYDIKTALLTAFQAQSANITGIQYGYILKYGKIVIFQARFDKTANVSMDINDINISSIFTDCGITLLRSFFGINVHDPVNAGTGSISTSGTGLAIRLTSDASNYFDVNFVALCK